MKIHLLDMGRAKYGDCILITEGEHAILVDGGHPGDGDSIRRQLEVLLEKPAPHTLDLLIVTHCHSDHIGCLPNLVRMGDILPEVALVADEKLGWGRPTEVVDGLQQKSDSLNEAERTLALALQEEDCSDIRDEDLEQFFYDVVRLEDQYKMMLEALTRNGTTVVRYGRHTEEEMGRVLEAGGFCRLKVLGPSLEHLKICADAIPIDVATDLIEDSLKIDSLQFADLAEAYRTIARKLQQDDNPAIASDSYGTGAAKNNQSIIVSVEGPTAENNWRALLAGDMQFAKAEVRGLNDHMQALLETVNQSGPYDFIKLTHHSSDNGLNNVILEKWNQQTKLFAHSGGRNDVSHPDADTLNLLEEKFTDQAQLLFARTDRNGIISIVNSPDGLQMNISRGDFNDFTPNIMADQQPAIASPVVVPATALPISSPTIEETNAVEAGFVEFNIKVPHVQTKVTFTIDVEPGKKKAGNDVTSSPVYNSVVNNRLAGLLFITSWNSLGNNLSDIVLDQLKQKLEVEKATVVDIPLGSLISAESAAAYIRGELLSSQYKGVVLLGGYDILPAQKLDVLPPELRQELKSKKRIQSDKDEFIIWSDDVYGDVNGDGFPELPVSRIPDGKDPELLLKALSSTPFAAKSRFGIRNLARPFATDVYSYIPGMENQCEISEKFGPENILLNAARGAVYYMLHGSETDGTMFWGEKVEGGKCEAFSIRDIPADASGTVVFTGCCWGGLIAEPSANKKSTGAPVRSRTPEQSIALKYIQSGANAFIGCTGSHYSPQEQPYNYYGKPLHDSFWEYIRAGKSAAEALFRAKYRYRNKLPHSEERTAALDRAVELKILHQFTVIGLGW